MKLSLENKNYSDYLDKSLTKDIDISISTNLFCKCLIQSALNLESSSLIDNIKDHFEENYATYVEEIKSNNLKFDFCDYVFEFLNTIKNSATSYINEISCKTEITQVDLINKIMATNNLYWINNLIYFLKDNWIFNKNEQEKEFVWFLKILTITRKRIMDNIQQ